MSAELTTTNGEARELATITPTQMLARAVDQNADLDKLEKLMQLERAWKADRAREAFTDAKAAFKKDPPDVVKDMLNKQYGSSYSSLANLVNTVNQKLALHDLDASWNHEQKDDNSIGVTCILTHSLGHSESVTLWGPPDTSGSKNALQQIRSTLTYLKAATFEAVTGIASRAANKDDDGGAAEPANTIDEKQIEELEALLGEFDETTRSGFMGWARIRSLSEINQAAYKDCLRMLERKRARKRTQA